MPAYVYRLWDANDRLLYVGMTTNPPQRRIGQHLTQRWWADTIVRFDFEQHATKEDALRAEAKAIRAEHPRWNLDGRHADLEHRQDWTLPRWYDVLANLRNSATEWPKSGKVSKWYDILCREFDALHRGHNEIVKNPPSARVGDWVWIPPLTAAMLLGIEGE